MYNFGYLKNENETLDFCYAPDGQHRAFAGN